MRDFRFDEQVKTFEMDDRVKVTGNLCYYKAEIECLDSKDPAVSLPISHYFFRTNDVKVSLDTDWKKKPDLDTAEIQLLSDIATDRNKSIETIESVYLAYRDEVQHIQYLQRAVNRKYGNLTAVCRRRHHYPKTFDAMSVEELLRRGESGNINDARYRLTKLIGKSSVQQVNSFLHVSPDSTK